MPVDGKRQVGNRVSRLLEGFGDHRAIQYQARWFDWSYVAECDRILEEILPDVAEDGAIAIILRSRPWCLGALIAMLGRGRCGVLMSPARGDVAILEDLRTIRPAALIADVEDWRRDGLVDECFTSGVLGLELSDDVGPIRRRDDPMLLRSDYRRIPEDVSVMALTSGTTGGPKRMPVTWSDFVPAERTVRDPGARQGVAINVLPLFSIGGIRTVSDTIFGGRPISLLDRFDVQEWTALIEEHGPRRAGAPPAVLRMVLDAKIPAERFRTVTSIYTASAPLPKELATEFEERYGIPIVQGYGATEFLGGVTGWPDGLHEQLGAAKRGSVGRSLPGIRVRVVDPVTGRELAPDVPGNLEVDSPNRVKGLSAGWVRTNDLARIDEEGFVWILGRTDDVIIRGGFKVQLGEVEAVLMEHPQVVDACVVGLSDPRLGEVPHAVVVLRSDTGPSGAELIEWVKARLSPYMTPASLTVVDAVPLNAMMKRDRVGVKELLAQARREADS